MRLAAESHARLERFFRSYEQDEALLLPQVFVHAGLFSHWLTRCSRISAITFGRHIFISRIVLERNECGRALMPSRLLAHEVAHVRQYQQAGFTGFIYHYLREYLMFVARGGRFNSRARLEAYEQISREREARGAETAYLEWRANAPPQPLVTSLS